jgi:hypothetical protein
MHRHMNVKMSEKYSNIRLLAVSSAGHKHEQTCNIQSRIQQQSYTRFTYKWRWGERRRNFPQQKVTVEYTF